MNRPPDAGPQLRAHGGSDSKPEAPIAFAAGPMEPLAASPMDAPSEPFALPSDVYSKTRTNARLVRAARLPGVILAGVGLFIATSVSAAAADASEVPSYVGFGAGGGVQDDPASDLPPPDLIDETTADESATPDEATSPDESSGEPDEPDALQPRKDQDDRDARALRTEKRKKNHRTRRPPGFEQDPDEVQEKDPLGGVRNKLQALPTPLVGALVAGGAAAAVAAGYGIVTLTIAGVGYGVDLNVTGNAIGAISAMVGVAVVTLIAAGLATFGAGGAILWVLGDDATERDWDDLYLAPLAVMLFFLVLPIIVGFSLLGVPCASQLCPNGLDSLSPRVARPVYWMLSAGLLLGAGGFVVGGLLGSAAGGQFAAFGNPLALSLIITGASVGFALGFGVGAPLGAAVGGAFGIGAPGARGPGVFGRAEPRGPAKRWAKLERGYE